MRCLKTLAVSVIIVSLAFPSFTNEAMADTALLDRPIHINSPSELTSEGGTKLKLPPVYILSEGAYKTLDLRLKSLENQETRLNAENKYLKSRANNFHWWFTGSVLFIGIVAGVYVGQKL